MSKVKKDYIICYDISNTKRLAKLARYLEKVSFRIQYSVFFLQKTTLIELRDIIDSMLKYIDNEEDDLRIYTIKDKAYSFGQAIDLDEPLIFV